MFGKLRKDVVLLAIGLAGVFAVVINVSAIVASQSRGAEPDSENVMEAYTGWAIVELMGHRRLGGKVSEAEQYGVAMLRLDIPSADQDGNYATQFYGGNSIYCVTPCTEETARAVARSAQPAPVHQWELPAPQAQPDGSPDDDDEYYDEDTDCRTPDGD